MSENSQLAGSFWSFLTDESYFQQFISAKELIEEQTQRDFTTFIGCAGRATTPLFRKMLLEPFTLRFTQQQDLSWPVPAKLASVAAITDSISNPSLVWLDKIDFILKDGHIIFRENPFERVTEQNAVHDAQGRIIDSELILWLNDAEYDEGYLNDMWGAAVGISAPSSEEYRALINVLYEAMIGGTSRKHVEQIVALFSGAKLAQEDETVVECATDSRGLFVATDKYIYRPVPGGQPVVGVGSRLKAGDPLFDTCTFYRAVDNVQEDQLHELTLPQSLLDASIGSDLTFQNREVPLTISDGRVEFEVGGRPEAVKRFWDLFNSRKAGNYSFAELLAGKTTINPFRFVWQHVLRNNCLLCVLRNPQTPPALSGIDQSRLLRLIVPPHETLLIAR